MGIDHQKPLGSLAVSTGALLARSLLAFFSGTCRTRIVEGQEVLDEMRAAGRPVVLSFWHEGSVLAAPFVRRELHRSGLPVTLLASQSRDGELVARAAEAWGFPIVRGSASRGGRGALRGTYRALVKEHSSPIMIPDGPRGPRYEFKVGVAVLAQMAAAPVLPLGFACSAGTRIRSWDRMVIPRPFARLAVAVAPPQSVEKGLAGEDLEKRRRQLEASVHSAWGTAWASCPTGPLAPPVLS